MRGEGCFIRLHVGIYNNIAKEVFVNMKRFCSSIVISALAAFFLLTTVSAAVAKQANNFYVGVFGGLVIPEKADLDWGIWGSDKFDLDESGTIGVKIGYIIPQYQWFAFEFEYNYQGEQDFDEMAYSWEYGPERYDGDLSSHNMMVNFLVRYPKGRIHPFAGGGIGVSIGSFNMDYSDVSGTYEMVDDDDAAFAWQLMVGTNFQIRRNLSADLTYKYFNSDYEFQSHYGLGHLDVDSSNHIIAVGINYHF